MRIILNIGNDDWLSRRNDCGGKSCAAAQRRHPSPMIFVEVAARHRIPNLGLDIPQSYGRGKTWEHVGDFTQQDIEHRL